MSDIREFQRVVERKHNDIFANGDYTADFYNYSDGSYDPDTGERTSQSRHNIATVQVEYVPPNMDTTVRTEGTSFSWDTSIRFPESVETSDGWGNNWGSNWGGEPLKDVIKPLGVDADRPTEVSLYDPKDDSTETYQLHGYTTEPGSSMIMCRLVEE